MSIATENTPINSLGHTSKPHPPSTAPPGHNFHISPWLQKMSTSITATIHSVAAPQAVDRANMMAKALKQGSKPWRRSKLSIVGEGRAGKSALANSFIGKPFEQTASTVGINQLTCDVKHIKTVSAPDGADKENGLKWGEHAKAEREFELALAEIIARNKRREGRRSFDAKAGAAPGGSIVNYINDKRAAYVELNERRREYAELVESGEEAVLDIKLNEDLVMKALATIDDEKSGLMISLFDFGGQSVFDVIHHLFLTRNGVYALVFNMEWLIADGPEKTKALSFLRGWLSSIAVHTYDFETQMTAPVVLVGTRLDLVTDPDAHQAMSTLLHEHFSDHPTWRSVIQSPDGRDGNGRALQCFFPVDNVNGGRSEAVQRVMDAAHGAMLSAAYTQKEVPLSWFAVIDRMNDAQRNCLSLAEVVVIGGTCGVSAPEIPLLLSFLHDMGQLMWIDEPGLSDVVVLDPVSYLVTPATIIICKLSPDQSDSTHHLLAPHRECERLHKKEWKKLKQSGILSASLLPILWKDFAEHTEQLLRLMTKFGLLVPLRVSNKKDNGESSPVELHLVPALQTPAPESALTAASWTDGVYESVYFVFTISDELALSSTITSEDLHTSGFMPGGIFDLVLGKALSWSQATAKGAHIDLKSVMLCKDVAVLAFGGQWFRLVHCADIHCLRVDIVGANPIGVQQKILDFIHEITIVLPCFPTVLYSTANNDTVTSASSPDPLKRSLLPSELLIPLEQLRRAARGESMLAWKFGRTLLSTSQIQAQYGAWLQMYHLRECYDVFISYRWGTYDSDFTATLFDMLTNFSVGANQRAVEVFLDRKRLRDGRQFKADFAAALSHSLIAVPVVSVDALARMLTHTGAEVDNVLLEWIITHECFAAGHLLKVFPVLFGARSVVDNLTGEVQVQDFFQSGAVALLPTIVPTATLTKASELLAVNGVPLSAKFSTYTVHSVVDDLLQFLLFKVPERPGAELVETFAVKLTLLLGECGDEALATVAPVVVAPVKPALTAMQGAITTSAAPSHTGRHLCDLSVEEVCALLEHLHLPKIALNIAQNQVSGMMLSFCETEQDLQTAEYGIPSEVLARGLLRLVKGWVQGGVPIA